MVLICSKEEERPCVRYIKSQLHLDIYFKFIHVKRTQVQEHFLVLFTFKHKLKAHMTAIFKNAHQHEQQS